jgi:hypothetical protein
VQAFDLFEIKPKIAGYSSDFSYAKPVEYAYWRVKDSSVVGHTLQIVTRANNQFYWIPQSRR